PGHRTRSAGVVHAGAAADHQRGWWIRGHWSRGLSFTTVSTIDNGAGSVGLLDLPALPNTVSTSGNWRISRSCVCTLRLASSMLRLGNVVGMYNMSPSLSGGMNSCP